MMNNDVSIVNIPEAIILQIFSFLDAVSLCKVRQVCHHWQLLSSDEILWKHKLYRDMKKWRQISNDTFLEAEFHSSDIIIPASSNHDFYLKGCPDILKIKSANRQKSMLQQLNDLKISDLFNYFRTTKRISLAMGGPGMDMNETSGIIRKILQFDMANVFQSRGQYPGRYRGVGGGFTLEYKKQILDLCLMYCAPKNERAGLTVNERISRQKRLMDGNSGYEEMFQNLDGFIYTINATVHETTEEVALKDLSKLQEELVPIHNKLKNSAPLLILSLVKDMSKKRMSSYNVAQALQLKSLDRPWMVSDCSVEMIYCDIVDSLDWLLHTRML